MSGLEALLELAPEARACLDGADHADVKTAEGAVDLRGFLAGMMGYAPWYLKALLNIRSVVVKMIGLPPEGPLVIPKLDRRQVPFAPGESVGFFVVRQAEEDRFWIGEYEHEHLRARLVVACQATEPGRRRFYAGTIVHYKSWRGPVYFNLIRVFHHLIVADMAYRAAAGP